MVTPRQTLTLPVGDLTNALLIEEALLNIEREGQPCKVMWDLDQGSVFSNDDFKYILRGIQIKRERADPNGNTIEFSTQLTFIQSGDEIIKIQ